MRRYANRSKPLLQGQEQQLNQKMNKESIRFSVACALACLGLGLSIAGQVSPSWAVASCALPSWDTHNCIFFLFDSRDLSTDDYSQGVISVSSTFQQGLWLVSLYSSLTFGSVAAGAWSLR